MIIILTFQLSQDADNYLKWKMLKTTRVILKKNVVPHKFECQVSRSKTKNRHTRRAMGNDRKEMVRDILDQGSTDGKMMLSTWFLHVFVNLNFFK